MKKTVLLALLPLMLLTACGDTDAPSGYIPPVSAPASSAVTASPPETAAPESDRPSDIPPESSEPPAPADELTEAERQLARERISQWSAAAIGSDQLSFILQTETDSVPMDLLVEMSGDNVSIAVTMPGHSFRLLRAGGVSYMLDDSEKTYARVDESFFNTYYAIADKTVLLGMGEDSAVPRRAPQGLFTEGAYHLSYQNGGRVDAYFNAVSGAPMQMDSTINGSKVRLTYTDIRMDGIDSSRLAVPTNYALAVIDG